MAQGFLIQPPRTDTTRGRELLRRSPGRILTIAAILHVAMCIANPPAARAAGDSYTDVAHRVWRLDGRSGIVVRQIGTSHEGRPLLAVILTSRDGLKEIPARRIRTLVLCGQHGNEKAPTYSALNLMESIANGRAKLSEDTLRATALALVPVVNPDGFAASRRYNASGVDLNRDWLAREQPETRAVYGLVGRFRPHVLMDMHEWTSRDPYQGSCLETVGYGDRAESRLARLMAGGLASGAPFVPTRYNEQSDRRLAHRCFTNQGICGILVETSPRLTSAARAGAYRSLLKSELTLLARVDNSKELSQCVDTLRDRHQPDSKWLAGLYSDPRQHSPTHYAQPALCRLQIAASCACLMLVGLSTRRNRALRSKKPLDWRQGQAESPRAFAMTEVIQSDLPIRERLEFMRRYRLRPTDRPRATGAAPCPRALAG